MHGVVRRPGAWSGVSLVVLMFAAAACGEPPSSVDAGPARVAATRPDAGGRDWEPGLWLGHGGGCRLSSVAELTCWGTYAGGPDGGVLRWPGTYRSAALPATGSSWPSEPLTIYAVDRAGRLWVRGASVGPAAARSAEPIIEADAAAHAWRRVSLGSRHACGIDVDGALWCWGDARGVVGLGADGGSLDGQGEPRRLGLTRRMPQTRFADVSCGPDFTCALTEDGALWCWGGRTRVVEGEPRLLAPGRRWKQLAAVRGLAWRVPAEALCAVSDADELWCWSSISLAAGVGVFPPLLQWAAEPWSAPALGSAHVCVLGARGEPLCWGLPQVGATGVAPSAGDVEGAPDLTPRRIAGRGFVALAVNATTSCGLAADDSVWCWGDLGALGSRPRHTAGPTNPVPGRFTDVTVGRFADRDVCGVHPDGGATCWGRWIGGNSRAPRSPAFGVRRVLPQDSWPGFIDADGGLRDVHATPTERAHPEVAALVAGLRVRAHCETSDHACVATLDGDAVCWGERTALLQGPLPADGGHVGVVEGAGDPFVDVACGAASCGLRASGRVTCWGRAGMTGANVDWWTDGGARLPDGGFDWSALDVRSDVALPRPAVQLVAGLESALPCAVTDDGRVWCWPGETSAAPSPSPRGPVSRLSQPADGTTCAIAVDGGRLSCRRANHQGVWTDDAPVEPPAASRWVRVSASHAVTCAVDAEERAWCWGDDRFGALGVDRGWSAVPVGVGLPP